MHEGTKEIRRYLKICPRKEFEELIYESKLTPHEEKVLRYSIVEGKQNDEVAEILSISRRTVSNVLNKAYDKIAKMKK